MIAYLHPLISDHHTWKIMIDCVPWTVEIVLLCFVSVLGGSVFLLIIFWAHSIYHININTKCSPWFYKMQAIRKSLIRRHFKIWNCTPWLFVIPTKFLILHSTKSHERNWKNERKKRKSTSSLNLEKITVMNSSHGYPQQSIPLPHFSLLRVFHSLQFSLLHRLLPSTPHNVCIIEPTFIWNIN